MTGSPTCLAPCLEHYFIGHCEKKKAERPSSITPFLDLAGMNQPDECLRIHQKSFCLSRRIEYIQRSRHDFTSGPALNGQAVKGVENTQDLTIDNRKRGVNEGI